MNRSLPASTDNMLAGRLQAVIVMDNKKQVFNNPFAELKDRISLVAPDGTFPVADKPKAKAKIEPQPLPMEQANNDDDLFAQAMRGVNGLSKGGGRIIPKNDIKDITPYIPVDEELEVMAHLAELVSGEEVISLSWFKDFVRASNSKVNPQLMQMLEQGSFPIQDYIDLHGLGMDEALSQVEEFLKQSRARGLRHVLIVHGKGKGSKSGESVLKETLSRCLCHKRFARWVLAFTNARQKDGGIGAMYVLLKTWQGPTIFAATNKNK